MSLKNFEALSFDVGPSKQLRAITAAVHGALLAAIVVLVGNKVIVAAMLTLWLVSLITSMWLGNRKVHINWQGPDEWHLSIAGQAYDDMTLEKVYRFGQSAVSLKFKPSPSSETEKSTSWIMIFEDAIPLKTHQALRRQLFSVPDHQRVDI